MENPWRAPVVAVEDGRVKYWESGLGGCMLYDHGRSGTTYLYIHLNRSPGPGDSGDASGNPHLHFEVHPNDGGDVNPFRHLRRATKPLFAARTLKKPVAVSAFTLKANATPDTIVGAPGKLALGRVAPLSG